MTADTVGGVWTYSVELAHALAPHDVEIHLATMGRHLSPAQRAEAGVFAAVHESAFPLEWMPEPWAGVEAAGQWLLELEEAVRPDVVHLNGYVHAALPWRSPALVVAHSDVLSWWQAVHGEPAPEAWDEYARRVGAGLRAADRVVAPTRAVASDLGRSYGIGEVAAVPNCRRAGLFGSTEKERFVLAAGRVWDEAKGIDAMARVAPGVGAPVLVAGDTAGADLPGVELLGQLPSGELAAVMSRAAVYAAPVRYEPFGLGILEAALSGCALVLGDVPSLRELWDGAAIFAGDDDALGAALTALLDEPGPAGAAARERALELTPERTAAGYLAVYAGLPERAAAS